MPIQTLLLAAMLGRERIVATKLAGIALGIAGVAIAFLGSFVMFAATFLLRPGGPRKPRVEQSDPMPLRDILRPGDPDSWDEATDLWRYTTGDIARAFGVTGRTVRTWIRAGVPPRHLPHDGASVPATQSAAEREGDG